jgi:hypothetical protein
MSMIFHFLSLEPEIVSQLKNSTLDVEAFLYDQGGNDRSLDIGKLWQIIHFVLTGKTGQESEVEDSVISNVIFGGKEIGEDVGYGPAHLIESEEVKAIAEELEEITIHKFIEMFKVRDLSNVGLYAFDKNDLEAEIECASECFDQIREYYLEAASRDEFMLLYLN